MPAKPVVVNSAPLVAFWSIGRLDILRDLFGEIIIPPAVREEFLSSEKEKIVSAVFPLLKALRESGLYLHEDLVEHVLTMAGER